MNAWIHPAFYQLFRLMVASWRGGHLPGTPTVSTPSWPQRTIIWWRHPAGSPPWHKVWFIWVLECDTDLTVLKWPPPSPHLKPTESLWNAVEQEIHIMQPKLHNCVMLSCQHGPESLFPAPCWIFAMKNEGSFVDKSRPNIAPVRWT